MYGDKLYVERTRVGNVRVVRKVTQNQKTLRNILSKLRVMEAVSKENRLIVQFIS